MHSSSARLGIMKTHIPAIISLIVVVLASAVPAMGVRLPALFSDGMVIQRDAPIHVWGWGDEGERVTVRLGRNSASATAKDGKWSAVLQPMGAGGPFVLTVTGANRIEVNDVLIGDVWVCSGQSNMQFELKNSFESQQDIAKAANPMIRLFTVPLVSARRAQDNVKSAWNLCSPESVDDFSAVGYYFGRDLQRALRTPIGLIDASWGGSPAEVWMRRSYARIDPELDRINALREGKGADGWRPGGAYNGMIAPLVSFPIKGVIWYQGESNSRHPEDYGKLFPELIRNWRKDWGQGDFPFLLVQLAPYIAAEWPKDSWPVVREVQLQATEGLPKVGMAVITDVGEERNIHPLHKEPVGARLALAARAIAYGQKLEYSGPIYKSMKTDGDKVVLSFTHVGKGLEARGGDLTGFEIAGEDGIFILAVAAIKGKTVVVSSSQVAKPKAVRYGWTNCPIVNLFSKNGLPASPFRTSR